MASLLAGLSQRFHLKIPYAGRNPGQGKGLPRDAYHLRRENIFVAFMVLWGATGQQRQDATNRDDRHLPAHYDTSNGARPRSTSALTCKSSASSFISFTLKAIRPVHFCETVDREQCNVSATSACVRPLSPIRRLTFSPTVGESTKCFHTYI